MLKLAVDLLIIMILLHFALKNLSLYQTGNIEFKNEAEEKTFDKKYKVTNFSEEYPHLGDGLFLLQDKNHIYLFGYYLFAGIIIFCLFVYDMLHLIDSIR